jgi:pyruvate formate lyase activating enzyme
MKTLFYRKLDKDRVRCGICCHYCVIEPGKRGICNVRENRSGTLESLVYPLVVARAVDPIEKKPIFHLKPGSLSYSIATVGCNFRCRFCQNADIAQMPTDQGGLIQGKAMEPGTIVAQALGAGCLSISYTYTEPTVFMELVLDTARIAREQGLLNILVTNGYMSPEVIRAAAPVIDAANVDLKAFTTDFYREQCQARLEPVKENLVLMKSLGILVEVTTLLIPGLNDGEAELAAMAAFIAGSLGVDTPWHISRFHPCHRMTDRERTPMTSLERAFSLGRDAGLRYVYTGNVPGLATENTLCHACGRVLIRRVGYSVDSSVTAQGTCPGCGTPVYGRF